MAQRAIININGDLIPFSEDLYRIRTPGLGGSAVTWVPDADTICDQLRVTANGTYSAAEAGKYGYDYVVVSVPRSSVTGRDPDTGEEVEVHRDPTTGEIVETVIPTEIRVIEPPTNPYGTYVDGQTITKDGMVVKAYGANGDEMQVVPIGEITINPTTATYDASTDTLGGGKASSELEDSKIPYVKEMCAVPLRQQYPNVYYSGPIANVGNALLRISCHGSTYPFEYSKLTINGTPTIVIASQEPANGAIGFGEFTGDSMTGGGSLTRKHYTYSNKTVYYYALTGKGSGEDGTARSAATAAWTMVYGTKSDEYGAGSRQAITVSWPRPGDGAILETTFDINVGPRGGSGED